MSDSTDSRAGRKPVFTRLSAFQMLENRRLYGGNSLTAEQFINEMVASGEMAKPCSRVTMARLLNGTLFPDLHNFVPDGKGGFEEGDEPYDYDNLPRRANGRPPRPERVRDDGSLRPKYTVNQKKILVDMAEIAEKRGANAGEHIVRTNLERVWRELETLRAEIAALRAAQNAGRPA